MLRREFSGNVVNTTLSANITSNSSNTFTVVDGSTFPAGSSGNPFVVVVSRGNTNEEKMLIESRTGNTLNVLSRGYDGTIANTHTVGAAVDHVLDATTIQDMNTTTYDNEINIWMAV